MPYINQSRRYQLEDAGANFEDLGRTMTGEPGVLNYAITTLIQGYLSGYGAVHYDDLNEVLGVLEAAKLELYRRKVAPFEDHKIEENGDVYK